MRGWSRLLMALALVSAGGVARAQDAGTAPPDAGVPPAEDAVEEGDAAPGAQGAEGEGTGAEEGAAEIAPPPGPPLPAPPPPLPQPAAPPPPEPVEQPPAAPGGQGPSDAVSPRQPLVLARRPLTVPAGAARIDGTFFVASAERDGGLDRQSYVSLLGVIGFGVTDDLEIGLVALPVQIAPEGRFNDPGAYGLYRLVEGTFEAGIQLAAHVPVRDESAFSTTASLRLLLRASDAVRLDGGVVFSALYHDPVQTALSLPVSVTFQASDTFFLGVSSGLDAVFLPGQPNNAYIPAGVFLGGTLRGDEGPTGDLRVGWYLPSVTDGTHTWILGFGGSFFVY